jgi:hypothetical protein
MMRRFYQDRGLHHHHRHRHHYSKDGYELAQYLGRELSYSSKPARFIVNEGMLIVDERTLDNTHTLGHSYLGFNKTGKTNTVVYNAPGSTMWVQNKHSSSLGGHGSRYLDALSLSTTVMECRGCLRLRERCYDGLCSDCILDRDRSSARRYDDIIYDERPRSLEYPERRFLGYR